MISPPPAEVWPLAGSARFDALDADWRRSLDDRLSRHLRRHVVEVWFPRSIDRARGGFQQAYDRAWRPIAEPTRMLEFQARQTRTVARLAQAFPGQPEWPAAAAHGLAYLDSAMADGMNGGWFWLVDLEGRPAHAGTKHAHGLSYLVGAAVEVAALSGQSAALDIARRAFEWLEAAHHDDEHGGYHGWVDRDGRPILSLGDVPAALAARARHDPLGHGIGLKDVNVHTDLLQAFAALAVAWPDERVRRRVDELYAIAVERLMKPTGEMLYATWPDWRPADSQRYFGYALQAASRLPAEALVAGRPLDVALAAAQRTVDWALDRAWQERRGGLRASDADPSRPWWIHSEALRGLLLLALATDDHERYRALHARVLDFCERELVDARHGGWYETARADVPLRQRLRGGPAKGNRWKDASHEADMCLFSLRALRGLASKAPLEG